MAALSSDPPAQARISVDLGAVPLGSFTFPALRNYLLLLFLR